MKLNRGSLTSKILKVLKSEREGSSHRLICRQLDDTIDPNNVSIYLSQMVKKGLLYSDGKHECECCGHLAVCYRISTEGRIALENILCKDTLE